MVGQQGLDLAAGIITSHFGDVVSVHSPLYSKSHYNCVLLFYNQLILFSRLFIVISSSTLRRLPGDNHSPVFVSLRKYAVVYCAGGLYRFKRLSGILIYPPHV